MSQQDFSHHASRRRRPIGQVSGGIAGAGGSAGIAGTGGYGRQGRHGGRRRRFRRVWRAWRVSRFQRILHVKSSDSSVSSTASASAASSTASAAPASVGLVNLVRIVCVVRLISRAPLPSCVIRLVCRVRSAACVTCIQRLRRALGNGRSHKECKARHRDPRRQSPARWTVAFAAAPDRGSESTPRSRDSVRRIVPMAAANALRSCPARFRRRAAEATRTRTASLHAAQDVVVAGLLLGFLELAGGKPDDRVVPVDCAASRTRVAVR